MNNIFDPDYFESYSIDDYAMESINAEKALTRLFAGPLGEMIQNIIHNKRIKKSVVASLDDCINAYGDSKGRSAYTKTVKFLQSHNFINETDTIPNSISFNDLTPYGKKFIKGYYSALDRIEKFDVSTAKTNAESQNAQNAINDDAKSITVSDGFDIGKAIAVATGTLIASTKATLKGGILSTEIGAALGIAGIVTIIIALIPSAFNISATIKESSNRKKFIKTMRDTEKASESVNIFDPCYFEI
jgi:hypothetical protein